MSSSGNKKGEREIVGKAGDVVLKRVHPELSLALARSPLPT
jgi:hypothetical protein